MKIDKPSMRPLAEEFGAAVGEVWRHFANVSLEGARGLVCSLRDVEAAAGAMRRYVQRIPGVGLPGGDPVPLLNDLMTLTIELIEALRVTREVEDVGKLIELLRREARSADRLADALETLTRLSGEE